MADDFGPIPFWDTDERGYEGPDYAANDWDRCVLGGVNLPGVVDTSGLSALSVKKAKASGKHGARVTTTGRNPQTAEIRVYIWTPAQWKIWQEVFPQIYGGDKSESTALDVYSPQLAMVGIKGVVVTSVTSPQPGRVRGEKMITIRVEELAPVKKANVTKSHKSGKDSNPPPLKSEFSDETGNVTTAYDTADNEVQEKPSTDRFYSAP